MLTEICSHGTLLGLLSSDPGRYDLLLITNPGLGPPERVPPLARRVLHLQFEDFAPPPRPGVRLPTAEDVRRALEWPAGGVDLAYVVRCRDWSPGEAIRVLTRGWHRPNDLVVRLGAELLRDPAVHATYAAWMADEKPPPPHAPAAGGNGGEGGGVAAGCGTEAPGGLVVTWQGQASHPISVRLSPLHVRVAGNPKMTVEPFRQERNPGRVRSGGLSR